MLEQEKQRLGLTISNIWKKVYGENQSFKNLFTKFIKA